MSRRTKNPKSRTVMVNDHGDIVDPKGIARDKRDYAKMGYQQANMTNVTMGDGKQRAVPDTMRDSKLLIGDTTGSELICYQLVVRSLEGRYGIRLKLDTQGGNKLSGHVAYEVKRPANLEGIEYPEDYRVLNRIAPKDYPRVTSRILDTINYLLETKEDYETGRDNFSEKHELKGGKQDENIETKLKAKAYARFMKVWGSFELGSQVAHRCAIALQDTDTSYSEMINSTGNRTPAIKWVPQLDWFDPTLSQISNEQLLSLIPEAERGVMMLFLGRVMNGRQGTPHTDGRVQKLKWRSVMLFEGPEAGMGRSTLLEYLSSGLARLGYNSNPINDLSGRFGHGRSANLDFGYIDDLTPDGTINALGSATLKTISSGATLSVEEKGEKSYTTTAIGGYMLCTNYLDLTKLTQLDSGNISRLMPMRNASTNDVRAKQYLKKYGYKINTDITYEHLSEQYGVPIDTLVLLLLARSSQLYQGYMDRPQYELVDRLTKLKGEFLIDTSFNHLDQMYTHYCRLQYTATGTKPHLFKISDYIQSLIAFEGLERIDGCSDTGRAIYEYAKEVGYGGKKRSSKVQLTELLNYLSSDNGLGYPSNSDIVTTRYRTYLDQIDLSDLVSLEKVMKDADQDPRLETRELTEYRRRKLTLKKV